MLISAIRKGFGKYTSTNGDLLKILLANTASVFSDSHNAFESSLAIYIRDNENIYAFSFSILSPEISPKIIQNIANFTWVKHAYFIFLSNVKN